jgi:imidazolonepropionase-like amidohydrolase
MMPHEPFDGTSVTVRELEFYVEAGMSPLEALRTATVNAAALLGRPDLGTVEAGALADFVVLRDDPLENIAALRRLETVVARGRVVAQGEAAPT